MNFRYVWLVRRLIALIHGALQEILNLYGEWLFERREFGQSALGM